MSSIPTIYLAGPEVFLPDPLAAAEAKKELCEAYGFEGVFPLDATLDLDGLSTREQGLAISQANEDLIRDCDLLIANLTPFRGPSADVGTVFELGFARGLGKPVFGYTNDPRTFAERTRAFAGLAPDAKQDAGGMSLESFDLRDNLMIDGAIHLAGGVFAAHQAAPDAQYTDLTAFEQCLTAARQAMLTQRCTRGRERS